MTPEEAIKELRDASDNEVRYGDTEHHYNEVMKRIEAFDMAIKALEQQPCEDCISREAVDEYITNLLSGYLYDEERTRLEDLTTYIWELPSVIPQPCEEAISRQAVMNIISFGYGWLIDAKEYNTNIRIAFNSLMSKVKALPSVTPKAEQTSYKSEARRWKRRYLDLKQCIFKLEEQQPYTDCVSRQEAISAIQDEYYDNAVGIDIVDIIAHLPSVTPKAESEVEE